ncbi:MAG: AraC family ligand binding domain-containing protein, partial [Verrucomicrobiota bacterium]
MTAFEDSLLGISAPFGKQFQKVTSSRYFWDNEQRSDEQFVIIQRTNSGQGIFSWEGGRWSVPPEHAFLAVVPEKSSYHYPDAAAGPWTFSWVNFYGPLAALLGRTLRTLHGPVLPLPKRSAACAAFDSITAKAERRVVSDP